MATKRTVYECTICDSAIYERVTGKDSQTCTCENVTVNLGQVTVHQDNTIKIHEAVPLRAEERALIHDYDEFTDRYGVIKNAKKVIPNLYASNGEPYNYRPRSEYDTFIDDAVEQFTESSLEINESKLSGLILD